MVFLEGAKDEEVKENDQESNGHPSSSHEVLRAYTALFESISSPNKDQPPSKAEENQETQKEEPFLSCIEPLFKKFEENLHHEFAYVDRLQDLVAFLQEENKSLREEIEDLNDFIFSTKLNHSTSDEQDMATLHNKIQTLEAALRIESFKANEYKKELDDARHALMRRTRARVKKGQSFELVIAQKPQEVTLASHATPFQDETCIGSCPICLEEFDIASGWYTLNCRHRYHLVCLAQVMPTRARCCVCNQELHKLLYEIFGMANKYPEDARLWDAQTGQPVDFTLEEDIRALTNEIQESEETEGEADEEDNALEEISIDHDLLAGDTDQSGDDPVDSQPNDNDTQQEEEDEAVDDEGSTDEDGEDEGSTDEDGEDDEDYSSEGEESYATSAEEGDDPSDPDYTPSQE